MKSKTAPQSESQTGRSIEQEGPRKGHRTNNTSATQAKTDTAAKSPRQ